MIEHSQYFHDLMDRRLKTLFSKILPRVLSLRNNNEFVVKYNRVFEVISFMYITMHLLQCYDKFLSGWSYCPFALPNAAIYEKVSV